jgi:hypothetical protein
MHRNKQIKMTNQFHLIKITQRTNNCRSIKAASRRVGILILCFIRNKVLT